MPKQNLEKNRAQRREKLPRISNWTAIWVCATIGAATLVGVLIITSFPDADQRFKEKYCYYANEDKIKSGEEQSKVYICPAPLNK